MGVLAHRLACLTVRLSPNRHERKISSIHICRVTFKHLPQPLWSYILSFETLWQLFKIPPFSAQKSHSARGRGVPQILFWVGILMVWLLRSPCKIVKPYNNHFLENEQKMPFIVATYVYASSNGQRTHSARTNILMMVFKMSTFSLVY